MTHFGSGGARELRKVPCDRPSKWPSYSPLEDAIGKNWLIKGLQGHRFSAQGQENSRQNLFKSRKA
eukprot:scaffold17256_cov13-Tisochrysis_lutea.AAC.1